MNAAADRLEFAPPPTAGLLRALGLALLVHLFLVAALTWGVHWKRSADMVTAEAELWSAVPQQAAPKAVEALPAPAPAPPPAPLAAPRAADADIALAREKLRLKKEKQQAAQKQEQDKRERQKLALEKKREQEERLEKLAQDKKRIEQEIKRKETLKAQAEASKLEAERRRNIARMAGLASNTGAPAASGTAPQSSGPSAGYGSRVAARVKPNIVFTEDPPGNPTAVVEVRTAPDGTIVGRKLVKTSGIKAWDEAVLKAIDKTEVLPRDLDGRVPPVLEISFRPRD